MAALIFLQSMLKILRNSADCVLANFRFIFLFNLICFSRASGMARIDLGLFASVIVVVEESYALLKQEVRCRAARSSSALVMMGVFGGSCVSLRIRVKVSQFVFWNEIFSRDSLMSLMTVSVGRWSLMWSLRTLNLRGNVKRFFDRRVKSRILLPAGYVAV